MKINKYIRKIIVNGLVGSLLLGSIPFNSFASNQKLNINNINEINNIEEISPQMLAVIASLAVGSGITITTDDDLYDIGRSFYDYFKYHKDLNWETVQSIFSSNISLKSNKLVLVKNEFLDVAKDYFKNVFGKSTGDINYKAGLPMSPIFYAVNEGVNDFGSVYIERADGICKIYSRKTLGGELLSSASVTEFDSCSFSIVKHVVGDEYGNVNITMNSNRGTYTRAIYSVYLGYRDTLLMTIPYSGTFNWDLILEKQGERNGVELPVPGNLGNLIGQNTDSFWNNRDNLINPCTQKITLPELDRPNINIGESITLKGYGDCSVYNAGKLVEKAEETSELSDLNNARNEVNKLPDSQDKQDLHDRLNSIVTNIIGSNGTSNFDVYINSTSTLTMTLDTNNITFEGFSGVEDTIKENALNVTVKSSLPYELNAYLINEIQNANKSKTLDKSVLNIKANGTDEYKTFEDIGVTPIQLLDNQDAGEPNTHGIDFKLDSSVSYETDNYKTVIKFEAKQK